MRFLREEMRIQVGRVDADQLSVLGRITDTPWYEQRNTLRGEGAVEEEKT